MKLKNLTTENFSTLPYISRLLIVYRLYRSKNRPGELNSKDIESLRYLIEKGYKYFSKNLERRIGISIPNYEYEVLSQKEFKEKGWGNHSGVCTSTLEIYLNERFCRKNPELLGGLALFHERVTRMIKEKIGQLYVPFEELIVSLLMIISV